MQSPVLAPEAGRVSYLGLLGWGPLRTHYSPLIDFPQAPVERPVAAPKPPVPRPLPARVQRPRDTRPPGAQGSLLLVE